MADINLLPEEEKAQEKFVLLSKRLQMASVGFLVLTALLTVLTLVLYTTFSSKNAQLVSEIENASSEIVSLKAQEELLVVVRDKTSASLDLLAKRVEFGNFFNKLADLVPQGVFFTDVRFLSGKAVFSGKAQTSADVAGLVSTLSSARGAAIVSDVAVDSLSSDEVGVFSFVISAKLVGQPK